VWEKSLTNSATRRDLSRVPRTHESDVWCSGKAPSSFVLRTCPTSRQRGRYLSRSHRSKTHVYTRRHTCMHERSHSQIYSATRCALPSVVHCVHKT